MDPRLNYDPEVPEDGGGEKIEPVKTEPVTEPKGEVKTEPEQPVADSNKATIPVQGPDGKIYNVTPTEANTLLQMGFE